MEYYEREERERELQKEREWQYIATSYTHTPNLSYQQPIHNPSDRTLDVLSASASPSPSPQSLGSKSINIGKRRTFQPPLPPLPNNQQIKPKTSNTTAPVTPLLNTMPMPHNEEASQSFGIPTPLTIPIESTSYQSPRKSSGRSGNRSSSHRGSGPREKYKSQRKYRKRSNSNVSYKSFKSRASTYKSQRNASYRNRSDISKSTMCSQSEQRGILDEEQSYNEPIEAANSPMPLSIGDYSTSKLESSVNNFHALPPKNPNMQMSEFSNNSLNILNGLNVGIFSAHASVISEEQTKYNVEEESHDCGVSIGCQDQKLRVPSTSNGGMFICFIIRQEHVHIQYCTVHILWYCTQFRSCDEIFFLKYYSLFVAPFF